MKFSPDLDRLFLKDQLVCIVTESIDIKDHTHECHEGFPMAADVACRRSDAGPDTALLLQTQNKLDTQPGRKRKQLRQSSVSVVFKEIYI